MSRRSICLVLIASGALLLAPSVASAAWTVTPTPNAAGPRTFLSGVDCSSASSCIAVGNAEFTPAFRVFIDDGGRALGRYGLADRAAPNPPGATWSQLNGVSCPQRNVCFAVGYWRTDPTKCRTGSGSRDRSSSAGTGRAGRSSPARTSRAARSTPSPAPGSWPAPRSGAFWGPPARSRSAGTAPAGTSSPPPPQLRESPGEQSP